MAHHEDFVGNMIQSTSTIKLGVEMQVSQTYPQLQIDIKIISDSINM
jgi:hypothetical protein